VRSGMAVVHELIADLLRKRQISELVAVEMTQLDLPEPKLDAPETMGVCGYSVPAGDGRLDRVACAVHASVNRKACPSIPRRAVSPHRLTSAALCFRLFFEIVPESVKEHDGPRRVGT
jgi:hypothetical protein